jgi:hypothetical protein
MCHGLLRYPVPSHIPKNLFCNNFEKLYRNQSLYRRLHTDFVAAKPEVQLFCPPVYYHSNDTKLTINVRSEIKT